MGWAIEPGLIRHQPLSYDKTFDSIHILLSIIQKVKQIPITVIRISLPRIKVFSSLVLKKIIKASWNKIAFQNVCVGIRKDG